MSTFLVEVEGMTENQIKAVLTDRTYKDVKVSRAVQTSPHNRLFSVKMEATEFVPEGRISYSSRSGIKSYGTMKQAKKHAEYDIVNLYAVKVEDEDE